MKYSTLTSVTPKNLCEQVSFMTVSKENSHKLHVIRHACIQKLLLHAANKKGSCQISAFVVRCLV